MSVLVYIPAILIGRALGLPAEIVIDGLLFVAVAISLTIVSALLMNSSSVLGRVQRWPFLILAAAVLTILPGQAFGQREHIAVVELLPALAILAMRINRERPAAWAVAIAGLGLGLALSFKPYFAIAVLFWVGLLAIHMRCWRVILAPNILSQPRSSVSMAFAPCCCSRNILLQWIARSADDRTAGWLRLART
jgi:hypothetical protein